MRIPSGVDITRFSPRGDGTFEIPVDARGRIARFVFPASWTAGRKRLTALVLRDGPHCHYCNRYVLTGDRTVDHVTPRHAGGNSRLTNLVMACRRCNCRKGKKPYDEFVSLLATEAATV